MKSLFPLLLGCLSLFLVSCAPSRAPIEPGTVPEPKPLTTSEEQYGHKVLGGLTEKWELDYSHPRRDNVNKVVKRLTKAAKADKDPWHIFVLKDDSLKNAAATRGNHVFIWTGMIDATQSDAELAAVLSHEIAHVLARHTDPDPNEELKKMMISIGAVAAGIAVGAATQNVSLGQNAADLTSALTQELGNGMLIYPYSREREMEADHVGLFMMADAKYNPEAAIVFWTRAQGDPSFNQGMISFLSTHPAPPERLEQLKAFLPHALARYKGEAKPPRKRLLKLPKILPRKKSPKKDKPDTSESEFDSFDVSEIPAETAPTPESTEVPAKWRVESTRAVLYAQPSAKSKALGEFKQGAVITVVEVGRGWHKIESPELGYLESALLKPYAETK